MYFGGPVSDHTHQVHIQARSRSNPLPHSLTDFSYDKAKTFKFHSYQALVTRIPCTEFFKISTIIS